MASKQKISPETFIEEMTQKCAPLEKKLCQLYWTFATTGDETAAKELGETEKTLKIIFSNPDEFAQLKQWQAAGVADPLIERQIDLLVKSYTPNQLDEKTIGDLVERQTEIEMIYNNFRAELDGKKQTNNDLKEILKTEKNSNRRKEVWESTKQIAPLVADKVRELAKKRNAAAVKLGFPNHFAMSFKMQELDSVWLFDMFGHLKNASEKTFSKKIGALHERLAKRYGIKPEEIQPWHYEDPFAQQAPPPETVDLDPWLKNVDILKVCREFYSGMDLDISDVLERSDLFEKQGKSQHAFCITMDRGRDVRVLANIRPNNYWASTMLHELGHAAYSKNIDPKIPYFMRDEAHIFATEAIAMLMERMMHHPHWLKAMLGIPEKQMAPMEKDLWEGLSLDKLIIARWVMVVTSFEKALYSNPDQDLNGLWWKLVKEFQLLDKPEGRDYPDWAAKIHIASAPVYYQNYLLGELMAAQIANTLEKEALSKPLSEVSFLNADKIGKILKERMFKMGSMWHWKKLVPHVTGEELSDRSFIAQFCKE
ncbi:MAG: M2 family metallopeptidase [Phaeospirillum sp.]|nr:M2 family metallopeptidase [Phaeospirillum sp.]